MAVIQIYKAALVDNAPNISHPFRPRMKIFFRADDYFNTERLLRLKIRLKTDNIFFRVTGLETAEDENQKAIIIGEAIEADHVLMTAYLLNPLEVIGLEVVEDKEETEKFIRGGYR